MARTSTARILVAVQASDPIARAGALHLLGGEPGIELVPVGSAAPTDGTPAVTVLVANRVDEATAVELRRCVREPGREVVLVAEPLREQELMTVLECGLRSVVRRDEVTGGELVAAVRSAARRETRLPPDVVGQLVAHVGRAQRAAVHAHPAGQGPVGLAPRELDVVRLLAEGLETRDVAEKLAYSERTIKNVLYAMTTRLQLRNRAHAVAYAFREGYL
jgi:DNA-binding NarL/FixJ family response regulator